MADYIKRDAVLRIISDAPRFYLNDMIRADAMRGYVKRLPAADVRENEYTTDKNGTPSLFECEKCGWEDWDTYTGDGFVYCPGCGRKIKSGADMRGKKDNA